MLSSATSWACALAAASLAAAAAPAGVPQYVIDYAPLSYLHSAEAYFPSSLSAQLNHTQPENNFTVVSGAPSPLTLDNLSQLNALNGTNVYLTSKDDITTDPAWLYGVKPDCNGSTGAAISTAVIVADKGNGTVDAFFMYFYAYNWGGLVLDFIQVDDHVGDWEHNMVRFENGEPTYVWYSQHGNGEAFAYPVLHKSGVRPINYVANGTHANYATSGTHDHTIPDLNLIYGLIDDYTQGPDSGGLLWDPLAAAYFYNYTNATGTPTFTALSANDSNDSASSPYPVDWLSFTGKWGDEEYPASDPRQQEWFGGLLPKYSSGPTGPVDKQLSRTKVCPDNGYLCVLRWVLGP